MADSVLIFNGVTMPKPEYGKVVIGKNKIWSENTGRNGNGNMIGSIKTIKRKLEIGWPRLTSDQVRLIDGVVSDKNHPFVPVQYTDETGATTTMTAYFGDITYTALINVAGKQQFEGVSVSAIEK